MRWDRQLPSKKEFARLIGSGHGRAALLVKSGYGDHYRKQVISACLFDEREQIDCEELGSYLAGILRDAKFDVVELLAKRTNSKAARRHRQHALGILKSLARRGNMRAKELVVTSCVPKLEFRSSGYGDLRFSTFEELSNFGLEQERPTYLFSKFSRETTEAERMKAARAISKPQPQHFLVGLLRMFGHESRPFPLNPSVLIRHAKSANQGVRYGAMSALSHIPHPKVRTFAEWCLQEHYFLEDAVRLFVSNQQPGDLTHCLKIIKENYDSLEWQHSAIKNLRHFADESRKRSERIAVYDWVYENSTCSACRGFAVHEMEKMNAVPKYWIPELRLDSESDCRDVAKSLGRRMQSVETS